MMDYAELHWLSNVTSLRRASHPQELAERGLPWATKPWRRVFPGRRPREAAMAEGDDLEAAGLFQVDTTLGLDMLSVLCGTFTAVVGGAILTA